MVWKSSITKNSKYRLVYWVHKLIKKIKTYVREEVGIGKYYYKNIITNIWNTYKLATNLIQNTSRILCVFIVYLTKQDNRHNKWTWSMYK